MGGCGLGLWTVVWFGLFASLGNSGEKGEEDSDTEQVHVSAILRNFSLLIEVWPSPGSGQVSTVCDAMLTSMSWMLC